MIEVFVKQIQMSGRGGFCWPQSANYIQDYCAEEKQTSHNDQMSNSRPPVCPSMPNHFLTVVQTWLETETFQPLTSVVTGDMRPANVSKYSVY